MPEVLTPERWERIKSLFEMALEMAPAERSSFIANAAGDDPQVRMELEKLLESAESATDFLEKPVLKGSAAAPAAAFESGDVLAGRFRIVRRIGKGGMGEVYEAEDRAIPQTHVALKTIRSDAAGRTAYVNRFREEVRLSRSITHPGVCRIYELFETTAPSPDGKQAPVIFLTMELLNGESLSRRISSRGPMEPRKALEVFQQVAGAMEAAQALGIVHCDLKSANIILVRRGEAGDGAADEERAVITDFGLARFTREALGGPMQAGTPEYMAPELFTGAAPAFTTDIYSFGVMAFEALTGKRPFARERLGEKPDRSEEIGRGLELVRRLDRGWAAVVSRCLEQEPTLRYGSARELSADLDAIATREPRMRRRVFLGVCAAFVGAGGYAVLQRRPSPPVPPLKLVVLPFEDLTPDRSLEFMADGLTDELIRTLSHIRNLRVVGRTSAFQFKRTILPIREIGRRLGCTRLVRGTVRRNGDRMIVHTVMADAATGKTIWERSDEEPVREAMAIKSGLALAMIGSWDLDVPQQQMDFVRKAPTNNPEAYNDYLLGLYQAGLRSAKGWENSLVFFAKATSLDPNFALAYAAAGDSYNALAGQAGHPIEPNLKAAKQNAIRGLELDPTSPEAHATFARVCQRLDWDWANADLHFREAINLNPGFATAHQWYGGFLSNLGKLEPALSETRTARDLDPLSVPVNSTYGAVLTRMGKWNEAIQQFRFTLGLAPNSGAAYSLMGDAYAGEGDWAQAIEMKRHAVEIFGDADSWAGLAYGLARSGRTGEALAILRDLENKNASHVALAQIYTGLGQYDEAIHQMEIAFDEHEPSIVSAKVEPQNAVLRSLPRFQLLLKKLRLSD